MVYQSGLAKLCYSNNQQNPSSLKQERLTSFSHTTGPSQGARALPYAVLTLGHLLMEQLIT